MKQFILIGSLALVCFITIGMFGSFAPVVPAPDHNPGTVCSSCHGPGSSYGEFKFGGTVYTDPGGTNTISDIELKLVGIDGSEQLFSSDAKGGNIYALANLVSDGEYMMVLDGVTSNTWHNLPRQKDCNNCHVPGGNGDTIRTKLIDPYHPRVLTMQDGVNDCSSCHHYPMSMYFEHLRTQGVLQADMIPLTTDSDWVEILGTQYDVEYSDFEDLETVRPDIFVPGYFSAFDVILAVADANGHTIEYEWDEEAQTHWITSVDSVKGEYWYKWNNDNNKAGDNEISNYNRQNRWDEFIYRIGTKIALIDTSATYADKNGNKNSVAALRERYHAEMDTLEAQDGQAMINVVEIVATPGGYTAEQGLPDKNFESPPEAERFDIKEKFYNVPIVAHNLRSNTEDSDPLIWRPFQPGVLTTMDIVLSLVDAGLADSVEVQYFDRIHKSLTEGYWFQSITIDGKTTHASGSNGFVYRSHLLAEDNMDLYTGFNSGNLNNGAGSMHHPQDLYVMHDHDYCFIRWMEIGPGTPYYELEDPGTAEAIVGIVDTIVISDWNSIDRGFNLRPAYPNPFSEKVMISFNIFEPFTLVNLSVYDIAGHKIKTLFHDRVTRTGEHLFNWKPEDHVTGTYFIVLQYGNNTQTEKVIYKE